MLIHATQQREFICWTFKIIRQSEGLSFKAGPLAGRAGSARSVPDYLRENNTTEKPVFTRFSTQKAHIVFVLDFPAEYLRFYACVLLFLNSV